MRWTGNRCVYIHLPEAQDRVDLVVSKSIRIKVAGMTRYVRRPAWMLLVGMLSLSACGDEPPNLTVDARSTPERAVYFVLREVKGKPGQQMLSGSSFGISRYRLGAVTALIGARNLPGEDTQFLKTGNSKVAETKVCLATENKAGGCPRFVFEMVFSPTGEAGKNKGSTIPVKPVLAAEGDILNGVQVFRCTLTGQDQRCDPIKTGK